MGRTSTSCFLLPHGGYSLIPTVLTTMAWVASIFQDGCDYAIIEGPIVDQITDNDQSIPWVEVGYAAYRKPRYHRNSDAWKVTYAGSCTDYNLDKVQLDPAWKASKAFAFLALILGGGGALFLWFSACCVFSRATWKWAGYEVLLASTFQIMSFMWYGNSMCTGDNTCSLSWGTKADIVAAIFWGLAAMAILLKYPIPNLDDDRSTITNNSDKEIEEGSARPNQRQRQHQRKPYNTTNTESPSAIKKSLKISPTSRKISYEEHVCALPLEGDAAATITTATTTTKRNKSKKQYETIGGGNSSKDLTNAEVL